MIMPREKREIQKEDIMPLDIYIKKRRELRKSIDWPHFVLEGEKHLL